MNDGIKEHNSNVNSYQTPAWRRLKYRICRELGASCRDAAQMRDYRLRTIKGVFSNLAFGNSAYQTQLESYLSPYFEMDASGLSQTYLD